MKSEICMNCADKSCYGYDHRITECEDFQPMTNADKIRSMSDYDLADFLTAVMDCCGNDLCGKLCPMWVCCNNGPDNVEDWLKSPVEVDNG